jgi:hypothetical protein
MPKDDGVYASNSSGPLGQRAHHNGDQLDETNFCRLLDILPENSIIYTRIVRETTKLVSDCKFNRKIQIKFE